jgi:hypothetical protein
MARNDYLDLKDFEHTMINRVAVALVHLVALLRVRRRILHRFNDRSLLVLDLFVSKRVPFYPMAFLRRKMLDNNIRPLLKVG